MKYMLLISSTQADLPTSEEEGQSRMQAWFAYGDALDSAGVLVAGEALEGPETAVTTDARTGVITDGPFAESKEVLGGFYLIDVDDQDAAVNWANKMPPHVSVEVRPVMLF